MSKVIDIINQKNAPFASFELVPPLKGSDISKLYNAIEPLMEFTPPFINITYHRDEVEYRPKADGTFEKKTITKRPGSVAIAAAIMKRFSVEVVPHLICGGSSKYKLENDLIDLNFLDIQNVVALRGDAIPGQKHFIPEPEGHRYSSELVEQIHRMNEGIYLDRNLTDAVHTNFCIGVAAYPEKHYEAPNLDIDIENLQRKVNAGADYIVTQMFFDNTRFYQFVDKCRAAGITVPIIPGLKPISAQTHIEMLPRTFSIDLPQTLMQEIRKCKDNKAIYQVGIEWCTAQSKDLLAHGAPAIHYYTMGKADNIREILKQTF
ncbi:MAG: methylenetetrahydrofolate reductase [NAD(P)H] [Odoribacter sp.]